MKNTKTGLQFKSYILSQTKGTQNIKEYDIAFWNNNSRKNHKVYTQEELLQTYNKNNYDAHGASKMTFLNSYDEYGFKEFTFKYIVIKRMRPDFYPASMLRGNNPNNNQVAEELKTFLTFEAEKNQYFNLLCPILRYDTVKSDHNDSEGKKALEKTIVISYKAIYISDWEDCCIRAEELNNQNNLTGEDYQTRYNHGVNFANDYNLDDIIYNGGNSGVIYNPTKNCYEAVFIDYAR